MTLVRKWGILLCFRFTGQIFYYTKNATLFSILLKIAVFFWFWRELNDWWIYSQWSFWTMEVILRSVWVMCLNGQISRVAKLGRKWAIPTNTECTQDGWITVGEYWNWRTKEGRRENMYTTEEFYKKIEDKIPNLKYIKCCCNFCLMSKWG